MDVNSSPFEWLGDKISAIFNYHTDRMWKKYAALSMSKWTLSIIESNDSGGGAGIVDANGNCTSLVYSNRTQRNLEIGRLVVNAGSGANQANPAVPHMGGANEWFGIFGGPGANLASCRVLYPLVKQGQLFPLVDAFSGHNALRFRGSEDVYFELRGSSLAPGTPITVTIYGALEPVSSDYDG